MRREIIFTLFFAVFYIVANATCLNETRSSNIVIPIPNNPVTKTNYLASGTATVGDLTYNYKCIEYVHKYKPLYTYSYTAKVISRTNTNEDVVIPDSVVIVFKSFYESSWFRPISNYRIQFVVNGIERGAFENDISMKSVSIPSTITSFGNAAFANCSNLSNVISFIKSPKAINDSVFMGVDKDKCCLYVPEETVSSYSETQGWKDFLNIKSKVFDDGTLKYNILGAHEVEVISFSEKDSVKIKSHNELNIPNSVTFNGNHYNVVSIGKKAFANCTSLTKISISNSIKTIEEDAFTACSNVHELYYEEGNTKTLATHLTTVSKVTIPQSVKTIERDAFSGFSNLTSISLPSSIDTIGNNAFYGCTGITSITIPRSTLYIGNNAFGGCTNIVELIYENGCEKTLPTGLTSLSIISIPNTVKEIGANSFANCNKLNYISLPNSVKNIGASSFSNCNSITEITIPFSVDSIKENAFYNCSKIRTITLPSSLVYLGKDYYSYKGYQSPFYCCDSIKNVRISFKDQSSFISYLRRKDIYNIFHSPNEFSRKKHSIVINGEEQTSITLPNAVQRIANHAFSECRDITSVMFSNTVDTIGNSAFYGCSSLTSVYLLNPLSRIEGSAFENCSSLKNITLPNSVTYIGKYAFDGTGIKEITVPDEISYVGTGAFSDSTKIYANLGSHALLYLWNRSYIPYKVGTDSKLVKPSQSVISITQTTATLRINNYYKEYKYIIDDQQVDSIYTRQGLNPEQGYSSAPKACKTADDPVYYSLSSSRYTTKNISTTINVDSITASSIHASGSYLKGDAQVTLQQISFGNSRYYKDGVSVDSIGLTPDQSYTVYYRIRLDNGKTYSTSKTITTKSLTLETQQPKVINAGNVIVKATSNLDDAETNVGFEWRRTDWTDDFASNTGGGYLYDGTMEGYIRNLATAYLWKYRPYYESNSGTRYYGDWVGIDPTNTSFFEPTVHTYDNVNVDGNMAKVKGYAQRGTDDVTEQGFMYWKNNGSSAKAKGVNCVPSIPNDAQTITVRTSSSPIIEATITGLDYNSEYSVVAFVATSDGTFYGEEQTFTTNGDPTGIIEIESDAQPQHKYPTGIYDLNGRKLPKMQRGVNIVRFEDGTVKKILVK